MLLYISPISYRVIVRCPCKTHSPAAAWSPDTQVWRENWVWVEDDTRMTPVYTRVYSGYDTRMTPTTPRWHPRLHSDTSGGKSVRPLDCKSPTRSTTNQPRKRALAVKWRLRTHSRISLQKTFLIKSAKLFPNNFQNKSVLYLTKSSDGQKIACAAH